MMDDNHSEQAAAEIPAERWLRDHLNGDGAHDALAYAAHGAGARLADALMDIDRLNARAERLRAEYDAALDKLNAYEQESGD